jgi:hypothetical protein
MLPAKINAKSVRKKIKKENLSDARNHFPYKINLQRAKCTTEEIQLWLIAHRYRSWKQKGLNGDYYYDDWKSIRFKEKSVMTEFILSLF